MEEEGRAERGGEGKWTEGIRDPAEAGRVRQEALRPCFGAVLSVETAVDAPLIG